MVANEKRLRTRSLPQTGHASAVAVPVPGPDPGPEVIGRRSSNGRSQARQRYS